MAKISDLRPNWLRRPLTLTFRCPKAIVARQQGHAPGFRAADRNAEGVVLTGRISGSLYFDGRRIRGNGPC